MDAVFALADRITVLVYGRQDRAAGAPARDPHQRRGAQGLSGRPLCCGLKSIEAAYDQNQVLFGTSWKCAAAKS